MYRGHIMFDPYRHKEWNSHRLLNPHTLTFSDASHLKNMPAHTHARSHSRTRARTHTRMHARTSARARKHAQCCWKRERTGQVEEEDSGRHCRREAAKKWATRDARGEVENQWDRPRPRTLSVSSETASGLGRPVALPPPPPPSPPLFFENPPPLTLPSPLFLLSANVTSTADITAAVCGWTWGLAAASADVRAHIVSDVLRHLAEWADTWRTVRRHLKWLYRFF